MGKKNIPNIYSEHGSFKVHAEIEPPPCDECAEKHNPPSLGLTITNISDDLMG